jgi:hypothetical protein
MDALEEDERKMRIAQLQHSIAWLSVDDESQASEYERVSSRRHDKTCEWIIQKPHIKSWTGYDLEEPLIWLSGKPGAGKYSTS